MSERTAADYAIEHAGYLATAAQRLLDARNELDALVIRRDEEDDVEDGDMHAAQDRVDEAGGGVRSAIYEFEKRRDRALAEKRAATVSHNVPAWIVVKEHVWHVGDGKRPVLAYLWPAEFARNVYPTAEDAIRFIKGEGLPLGWVSMQIDVPVSVSDSQVRAPVEATPGNDIDQVALDIARQFVDGGQRKAQLQVAIIAAIKKFAQHASGWRADRAGAAWVIASPSGDACEARDTDRSPYAEVLRQLAQSLTCGELGIEEDVYWQIADMIEPHVQREGTNPHGTLPASVHDAVSILFNHWLRTRGVRALLAGSLSNWQSHIPKDPNVPGTRAIRSVDPRHGMEGETDYNNDVAIWRECSSVLDRAIFLLDGEPGVSENG